MLWSTEKFLSLLQLLLLLPLPQVFASNIILHGCILNIAFTSRPLLHVVYHFTSLEKKNIMLQDVLFRLSATLECQFGNMTLFGSVWFSSLCHT